MPSPPPASMEGDGAEPRAACLCCFEFVHQSAGTYICMLYCSIVECWTIFPERLEVCLERALHGPCLTQLMGLKTGEIFPETVQQCKNVMCPCVR